MARLLLAHTVSSAAARALSPDIFLPDSTIKKILDSFATIDSSAALQTLVSDDLYIHPHLGALWEKIESLKTTFSTMREKHDKKRLKAAKKKAAEGAKGAGKAGGTATGEYIALQQRTLEECSGSFQLVVPAQNSQRENGYVVKAGVTTVS
ncbi:hypothetical protein GSI_10894 [Ganoderma sinense ZZ0214-1]|uniref:Uncharacterized protein n=1 Tax=Ganoderma sinense ZZ0214-1 TaxID=1077348 RepID=A0A2G8S1W5_9APHY|nr:hypothetical protein GSI_10894 [Ganoderma sinense ZZ0214-1]